MTMLLSALQRALEAKQQNERRLMQLNNVVATGVGFKVEGTTQTQEPSVVVSVVEKLPVSQLAESQVVPRTVDGVKTDVIETGRIVAFENTGRLRPARPGSSVGHFRITAGTFGCLVRRAGTDFILSNNHVLANSNDASPGDAILQPGPHDGGTGADQIATLEEYIPIGFDAGSMPSPGCAPLTLLARLLGRPAPVRANQVGDNKVDCAIARPLSADLVTADILEIGVPAGIGSASLGTPVQKSGRTTGYTQDQIIQIDVTVAVDYGGKVATFTSQLMAGAMSQGGDSGSAVLDAEKRVVGLLFAGSNTTTILNPIQFVLDALQVQLVIT